jgi:hypothetical protein
MEGEKRVLPTCSEVTHRAVPGMQLTHRQSGLGIFGSFIVA